jgi:2-dehydro-3-deoxygluconokinase
MQWPLKKEGDCRFDLVSIGEVMLRLNPREGRIRTAHHFTVWEGGGEYNVARGLAKCFRMRTSVVTALPRTDVGWLVEELILRGGVCADHIAWLPYDGIGREHRVGLNFTERGFGILGAKGVSDRGHSAASALTIDMVDCKRLFQDEGARWMHTGGIFAALSENTATLLEKILPFARSCGTLVSYDLNFRPSLWKSQGGIDRAREINRRIIPHVDLLFGNEGDFTAALGYEVEATSNDYEELEPSIASILRATSLPSRRKRSNGSKKQRMANLLARRRGLGFLSRRERR